jgi:hypothetical protein
MGRQIVQAKVSFYLYNHSGGTMVNQDTTEKIACNLDGRATIKG